MTLSARESVCDAAHRRMQTLIPQKFQNTIENFVTIMYNGK